MNGTWSGIRSSRKSSGPTKNILRKGRGTMDGGRWTSPVLRLLSHELKEMKSKIHFFTPKEKAGSTVDVIRHQLMHAVKDRDFWFGTFFVVVLLFLFVLQIESPIPNYNVGEIAHATVRASQDIQVPDTLSTERKRSEAERRVLPVYDYETGLLNSSVSRLEQIFQYLKEQPAQGKRKQWESVSRDIQSQWKIFVDPSFLAAASKKSFGPELEKYLSQKLRSAMSEYIISDRKVLLLNDSDSITIRDRNI